MFASAPLALAALFATTPPILRLRRSSTIPGTRRRTRSAPARRRPPPPTAPAPCGSTSGIPSSTSRDTGARPGRSAESPGLRPADEACVRAVVARKVLPGMGDIAVHSHGDTHTKELRARDHHALPASARRLAAALARGGARAVRTGAPGAPCAAGAAPRRGRPRRLPDCPPGVAASGSAAALAHTGGTRGDHAVATGRRSGGQGLACEGAPGVRRRRRPVARGRAFRQAGRPPSRAGDWSLRLETYCLRPLEPELVREMDRGIDEIATCVAGAGAERLVAPRLEPPKDRRLHSLTMVEDRTCGIDQAGAIICCGFRAGTAARRHLHGGVDRRPLRLRAAIERRDRLLGQSSARRNAPAGAIHQDRHRGMGKLRDRRRPEDPVLGRHRRLAPAAG